MSHRDSRVHALHGRALVQRRDVAHGSESEWSRELSEVVVRLGEESISLERLVQAGLSAEAYRHVLVIDHNLASWPLRARSR
jgi:hypothetical protein